MTEGLLEELPQSVSETILQNQALGRPLDEGVSDAAALGLLSGAAMGAGAGMFAKNRAPQDRITPTEDMGQEDSGYGPTNPLDPNFNPAGLLGNQAAPQLGFQGRASNQFNTGPNGEVFTGDQYNEYLAGQQERAQQARDAGMPQPRNFDDVTQAPQGYEQSGNDPRLPAPTGADFTASQDGEVYGRDDINTRLNQEREQAIERRARIARGEILDNTPIPEAPKPSELMGLDANKGSLSAAAVLAVDSGASDVGDDSLLFACKRVGIKQDKLLDCVLVGIVTAIIGARLYYVAFKWDVYSQDPISILYINEGGLAIYGGLIGGLIGVALGIALSAVLCKVMGTTFTISYSAIALGVGFSAAVGILFGWSPARKASNLSPIDALRRM